MHRAIARGEPLRRAALLSVALHSIVLIPLWIIHPASFDVARGSGAFEIHILSGDAANTGVPEHPSVRHAVAETSSQDLQAAPVSHAETSVPQRSLMDQALASWQSAHRAMPHQVDDAAQRTLTHSTDGAGSPDGSSIEERGGSSGAGAFITARPSGLSANRPPAYPRAAREHGWEGVVILHVQVETDGSAAHVEIATGSGYDVLDHAAQDAVARWRFLPARRAGHPLTSVVEVPIRFQLTSAS